MRKLIFAIAVIGIATFVLSANVYAQTTDDTQVASEEQTPSSTDAVTAVLYTQTETTTDQTPTEANAQAIIPSGWSLFWRAAKERLDIGLTFDPVKKAEKQVAYAETRLKLAEILGESNDLALQQRAQNMIERANALLAKVEEKKSQWAEKNDEQIQLLKTKLANHYANREDILNKLEEKVKPELMKKFEDLKLQGLENGKRLINAINNPNISEEVRAHLEAVKQRIEDNTATVQQFRAEKKDLLEKAAQGDETAKEELRNLQAERLQIQTEIRQQYQQTQAVRQELRQEIQANKEDVRETNQQNRAEVRMEVRDAIQTIKQGLRNQTQTTTPPAPTTKICTQEAMVCPDGSSVGRRGPNCEFAPCPEE